MAQEYSALRVELVKYQLHRLSESTGYAQDPLMVSYQGRTIPVQRNAGELHTRYGTSMDVMLDFVDGWGFENDFDV